MKTIAQILKKAKKDDTLTNGKLYWQVIDTRYDGYLVVAIPITKNGQKSQRGFEIWSSGIESVAVIPGLRIVK